MIDQTIIVTPSVIFLNSQVALFLSKEFPSGAIYE